MCSSSHQGYTSFIQNDSYLNHVGIKKKNHLLPTLKSLAQESYECSDLLLQHGQKDLCPNEYQYC